MSARFALTVIVLGLIPLAAIADPPVVVGVIEDTAFQDLTPAMSSIHVRLAFQKQGMEWIPFGSGTQFDMTSARSDPSFPATVNWTVVFDGKQLGNIISTNPEPSNRYADIGVQAITTAAKDIPRVRIGARDFHLADRRERTRPLLVVSVPNFYDPEGWKVTSLTVAEKKLAIAKFRNKFPKMEQCDDPETKPIHMVPYFDDEIVFIKAYRSKSGDVLYGQKLDDTRSKCGFFDDEHFFDYWFLSSQHNGIQLLDSQMTPMDAADLDGNGHSEWVFQTSRGRMRTGTNSFMTVSRRKHHFIGSITRVPEKSNRKADAHDRRQRGREYALAVAAETTGSTRPILLKNSLSVQTRFFSFKERQPKIRGKHDVRVTEKD